VDPEDEEWSERQEGTEAAGAAPRNDESREEVIGETSQREEDKTDANANSFEEEGVNREEFHGNEAPPEANLTYAIDEANIAWTERRSGAKNGKADLSIE
jgi:hypothetical protein